MKIVEIVITTHTNESEAKDTPAVVVGVSVEAGTVGEVGAVEVVMSSHSQLA